MVSCLALLGEVHRQLAHENGFKTTACGLYLADEHVRPGLFAESPEAVTCGQCVRAATVAAPAATDCASPASLVRSLLLDVLGAKSHGRLESIAEGRIAQRLTAHRLTRLHELFPGWTPQIGDLIADRDSVMARYDVTFEDAFGLLGPRGPATRSGQATIFRIEKGRLVDVSPIVDVFGLWDEDAAGCQATCLCPRHGMRSVGVEETLINQST